MADQSFQQAMQVSRIAVQGVQMGVMLTTSFIELFIKSLESGDPIDKELAELYSNNKAITAESSIQDKEEFERIMKEHGFAKEGKHPMTSREITLLDGTKKAVFLVMKNDENLLQDCISEFNKEHTLCGMISKEDMVRYAGVGGKTFSIEMPPDCAIAMVRRAEQYGLKLTGVGPYTNINGEEKFKMFFAEKDRMLFNRVQIETMCDIEGRAGAIYRTMLEKESQYKAQAMSSMISGRTPDLQDIRNGTMLVNKDGVTLESKGGKLLLTQPDGHQTSFNRADIKKDMVRAEIEQYFSFGQTALLSPEQAQKYTSAPTLEQKEKVMMLGRNQPVGGLEPIAILSKEEMDILKQHEAQRELINQKLQEENPAYNYMSAQILDNSPIAQFMDEQNRNADITHDIGQRGIPFDEREVLDEAHAENMANIFTEPVIEEVPDAIAERVLKPQEYEHSKESQGFDSRAFEENNAMMEASMGDIIEEQQ